MMGKMEIRTPPGSRPRDGRHCDLCGCSQPAVRCDKCGCQIFCLSCDDMYHRHPKRRFHLRKAVDPAPPGAQARPVLPVKVSHLNSTNPGDPSKMPLPPPRKKKSLFSSFRKPSPSSDNSPPLPKKEYSWTDRLGSIKKFMSNRPLPPLPTGEDSDMETQPTTNGQPTRGDLTFIHKKTEERPPQLPQRSPRTPDLQGVNQEKENRIPGSTSHVPGQIRNGSLEPNANHMNQNHEFSVDGENHWNNQINRQNGPQAFGTLNRQTLQRGFMPPGTPNYPGGMHQSSSATDLHSLHNVEGMQGTGPVPPHYPHYPMNPHMPPPHYPYPMYPQYPNYPQYFGNSFANLSNPPTTSEGDLSDSESASRHSSTNKKHPFRKRAKRSQSVVMDKMAYPGQFFPFGPYPGYGPWGAPMPMEAPPSPASSIRSLNRTGRSRRRKKLTSEDDDDEEYSETSSPMSRPKSSSSDPKEPRAPLATQTTSSDEESEDIDKRRDKINTIRRQFEPVKLPSPSVESKRTSRLKKSSSKQSDSDAQETPEVKSDRRPSDSSAERQRPVQKSPLPRQSPMRQSPIRQSPMRQSPMQQSPVPPQQSVKQQPSTSATSAPADSWECKHCTYINAAGSRICQVCCKTASPRTDTPTSVHSRPSSSAAANRKESVGSDREFATPDIVQEDNKKEKQDMASLNSALDEAEKQISKGLEELMKLKDDIDANMPKTSETQTKPESEGTSKPIYKSSGRMRTSILDKLSLNKPQTSNASVSTSTETQTGQENWKSERIIEARRHSNSSSDAYNSPLAQSPELEKGFHSDKPKRDSSCQTQQDGLAEYLERRKAAEEAFLGRPVNNFGFGYNDRMDMVTSPVPSMYDRFFGGGYGGLTQRSHSRASLFTGRLNDLGPMDYGPGFGYDPTPMYRSVSRGSLTGDYPEFRDGRISGYQNLRKPDFYLSMEELVERRRQDNIRAQGLELVRMIREAEQQGFNADDIQVALTHCGKQNPLEWLQDNWRNMVDSVVTLSTNYGNDKKENDIGLLSENEAREALRLHKGNIWAAVTECVEGRQRKYLELSARGKFSRQDIVDALTSSDGEVEMAYAKLTKSTGKPFLMRIWGQGEGVQNQDGAQPIPDDFNDGPRKYYKDETLNSDEFSDEIWSEEGDGVEWDDEEEYEEGERGDIEDLRTCQEDLQTSPQEMMTPESEKSDYIDAFTLDDRNASSPSDDIFFVIPEAKPEKKKGFLSKLAAFRRDSKEKTEVLADVGKDNSVGVPQAKEDSISQKSNSSTEQQKNNGAFNSLKSTFSAIKDTVTGGTKTEKKVPCAQPERRTIIVKGQLDHESLNDDSKDKVKLTSIRPSEESQGILKSDSQSKEQVKNADESFNEDTVRTDGKDENLELNQKNRSLQAHETNTEDIFKQTEENKAHSKKPQSLAERLKFAKQTRSSTNSSSSSAGKGESSTFYVDAKSQVKELEPVQEKEDKNSENVNSKDNVEKEVNIKDDFPKINQTQVLDTNNKQKTTNVDDLFSQSVKTHQDKDNLRKEKSNKVTVENVSPNTAQRPSASLCEEPNEIKTKPCETDNSSAKNQTVNSLEINPKQKEISSKVKQEESSDIKHSSKPSNDSKAASLSHIDKTDKIDSKMVPFSAKGDIEIAPKSEQNSTEPQSSHNASTLPQNDISSPVKKPETPENVTAKVSAESITLNVDAKDVKSTDLLKTPSPVTNERKESAKENSKKPDLNEDINQKFTDTSVNLSPISLDSKRTDKDSPEALTNQNSKTKSEESLTQEGKNQEPLVKTSENIENKTGGSTLRNVQAAQIPSSEGSFQSERRQTTPPNVLQESEGTLKNSETINATTNISKNTVTETKATDNIQEASSEPLSENEIQISLLKPEASSEPGFNASKLNVSQEISENIDENTKTDNSKAELESEDSTSSVVVTENSTELSIVTENKNESKESILNTTPNEKDLKELEQRTHTQESEVIKKVVDSQSNQTDKNESLNTTDVSDSHTVQPKDKNTSEMLLKNDENSAASSKSETNKSDKLSFTKSGKIKKVKTQEKGKKSAESTSIQHENKASTSTDVSLRDTDMPSNKITKILTTENEEEKLKHTESSNKLDSTNFESESANDSEKNEVHISDENHKQLNSENKSDIASKSTESNEIIITQLQSSDVSSNISSSVNFENKQAIDATINSQSEPEMERNLSSSTETSQNSSTTVPSETELQAPVFSKEFRDTKSNFTASTSLVDKDKTTSSVSNKNAAANSQVTVIENKYDDSLSKTSESSSSTDASNEVHSEILSSNTNKLNDSETRVGFNTTTVPDSKTVISSLTSSTDDKVSLTSDTSSKTEDPLNNIEVANSKSAESSLNAANSETSPSTSTPANSSETAKTLSSEPLKRDTTEQASNKDSQSSVSSNIELHSSVQSTVPDTTSGNETSSSQDNAVSSSHTLQRTISEDDSISKSADSDYSDTEYSDDSRSMSIVPPSPVDALRSRFEGLANGTIVKGRPASPFRRMSFNTRKLVIAQEKKRDSSLEKPWFNKKPTEPLKKPQPKRSIKQQLEMEVHEVRQKSQRLEDKRRKVRKMVADRKCRTYRKAEIVVQLMDMNFEEEEAIQAANECSTLEQAISYLQQECLLCAGHYSVSQIISMTHCQHKACRECIRAYFTVQIRDRTILDLLCPFCNEPDIRDEDVAQDYFNHLDIMLKKLVDVEIHELFQRKLRDRVLMKDPNFRWCSQCASGFIAMPNLKRLICPDCNAVTCASCRRLWEKEHQGISCEAFAAMKDASDPEAQAAGLAKMLTEDGISCPSCHFRYALAKGGCMHFRCIQCQHDFCSGCSRPFKMGQKCGVSEFCSKLGLHAHHPRNCLFYLRDKEPEDLQKLLDMNDVKYNRDPTEGMELTSTCQVMEQKETADGMVDDYCGKEVQEGFAGLCRVHYVEYLGQLVNKYKVDPIQIFDNDDLELVLRRANIRLPPKKYRETDQGYRDKLVKVIEEELPLDKMDGS